MKVINYSRYFLALASLLIAVPGLLLSEVHSSHEAGPHADVSQNIDALVDDQVSQPMVPKLMHRMSEALKELNYEGRFVYVVGAKMSSFEVQHAVIDGKEHERLVFLNEKKQEVVRIGHAIYCIHLGNYLLRQHEELSANPFSKKLSKLSQHLYDNYEASIQDNKVIAGRDAYKLNFKSKDSHRYDHSFWVDKESYLLLKAEIIDPIQGALESFEYVQVKVGQDIPLSEFQHDGFVRHAAKHFKPKLEEHLADENHAAAEKLDSESTLQSTWHSTWLPAGFYFSGDDHARNTELDNDDVSNSEANNSHEDAKEDLTLLMYTDGMAAVTVFIEKVTESNEFSERSQVGATSVFSHSTRIAGETYRVTVIGEMQLSALERIAKGVSLRQ